jgi:flagellar motor switch protein FliG
MASPPAVPAASGTPATTIAAATVGGREITRRQRAGILITSIGIEAAAAVFRNLEEEEVEDLTACINEAGEMPRDIREAVVDEFLAQLHTGALSGGLDAARVLLINALGKERAEEILDRLETSQIRGNYFEFLNLVDARQVATVIQQEQPQTIALVLSHLKPVRAAEIISFLNPDLQGSVFERIGTMDRISPEVVARVEGTLHKQFAVGVTGRLKATGGSKTIAEIMNHVDRGTERRIFDALQASNPDLVEEIKRLMLVFEDLATLPDAAIQNLLREVDMPDISLSLKGTSPEMKELIFRNLSKRAAERLKEEMEFMGPKPRKEVEEAQQRVVAVVRRLEEEGKVTLGRGGATAGDEMLA